VHLVPVPTGSSSAALVLNPNSSLSLAIPPTPTTTKDASYGFLSLFCTVLAGRAQVTVTVGAESQVLDLSVATSNVSVEIAFVRSETLDVKLTPLSPCHDRQVLCGERTSQSVDANLTAVGSLDWVHWGLTDPASEDRKKNPRRLLISELTSSTQVTENCTFSHLMFLPFSSLVLEYHIY